MLRRSMRSPGGTDKYLRWVSFGKLLCLVPHTSTAERAVGLTEIQITASIEAREESCSLFAPGLGSFPNCVALDPSQYLANKVN